MSNSIYGIQQSEYQTLMNYMAETGWREWGTATADLNMQNSTYYGFNNIDNENPSGKPTIYITGDNIQNEFVLIEAINYIENLFNIKFEFIDEPAENFEHSLIKFYNTGFSVKQEALWKPSEIEWTIEENGSDEIITGWESGAIYYSSNTTREILVHELFHSFGLFHPEGINGGQNKLFPGGTNYDFNFEPTTIMGYDPVPLDIGVADIQTLIEKKGFQINFSQTGPQFNNSDTEYHFNSQNSDNQKNITFIDTGGFDTINADYSKNDIGHNIDLSLGGISYFYDTNFQILSPSDGFYAINEVLYHLIIPKDILNGTEMNLLPEAVISGSGNDTIWANQAENVIVAGRGNDVIHGLDNNDVLIGQGGSDEVYGGEGSDLMIGDFRAIDNPGAYSAAFTIGDYVYGGANSDIILGSLGQDDLYGDFDPTNPNNPDNSNEAATGGASDFIFGYTGDDRLFGGEGADNFYFMLGDGQDVIEDFESQDTLEFEFEMLFSSPQEFQDWASDMAYFEVNGVMPEGSPLTGDMVTDLINGGALSVDGSDILLTFRDGGTLRLANTTTSMLDNDSFDINADGIQLSLAEALGVTSLSDVAIANHDVQYYIDTYSAGFDSNNLGRVIIGDPNNFPTLIGTAFDDTAYSNGASGVILAGAGDDYLSGGTLQDGLEVFPTYTQASAEYLHLHGEAGDDTLWGSRNNDKLYGGLDNDTIVTNGGYDEAYGGSGNDTLKIATLGNDPAPTGTSGTASASGNSTLVNKLYGDAGDDELIGGASFDELYGGADNDALFGDAGDDYLEGNQGDDVIGGGNGDDTIFGGSGNDQILGDTGNDVINAGDGNDTIYGDDGNDVINGGTGTDTASYRTSTAGLTINLLTNTHSGDAAGDTFSSIEIFEGSDFNDTLIADNTGRYLKGADGNDDIDGGNGNDILYGDDGADTIHGSDGNDEIYGGRGDDTLYAGTGIDILYGGDGNDFIDAKTTSSTDRATIYGGNGDDIIKGSKGSDGLYGGTGNDDIVGSVGRDTIEGGTGDDIINGQGSDDIIDGNQGQDTIYGGSGGDTINGGDDNDSVYGESGADTLSGNAGDDVLYGGSGSDILYGGSGNDILDGHSGNEVLYGNQGDDVLYGGAWADTLYGGNHDDTLYGGQSNDNLTGGSGADTFIFNTGDGHDVITDFTSAEGDTLVLDQSAFDPGTTLSDIASSAFINGNGDLRINVDTGGSITLEGMTSISVADLDWLA